MKTRSRVLVTIAVLTACAAICAIWSAWLSPVRVGFVNYQTLTLGQISKANDSRFIRIRQLDGDELRRIGGCDFVFINGMGMRITEDERAMIQKAADRGVPMLTTMATNPANDITTVDSLQRATLSAYLSGGDRTNYRNMLEYVRSGICGRRMFVSEPEPPGVPETGLLFHSDVENPGNDDLVFASVHEYEEWLRSEGLFNEGAPSVVVTGPMGEPSGLVAELERSGVNVYPVSNMRIFILRHHADSLELSALVNMAHGRMGDYIVDFLEERNVPLFSPLNVNTLVSEWEKDRMGMSGGFMSQSIVTPEIDGAIRPFALFGHYEDRDGLQYVKAIPGRLEEFVETVCNYISLQRTPNRDKKVAIFYYKGPGQNTLTAAGMEVLPSLYNFLKELRAAGYKVDGLPSDEDAFERLIQKQGAVFGAYAKGAIAEFISGGNPQLVSRDDYDGWCADVLGPEMAAETAAANGEFPGSYLATDDGRLALPRVELGNVVLLPQLAAGTGDDEFKIVHGTDNAPPYPYVAEYLWAREGFGADVMIHFGTHGSLEFTPSKQVALSSCDWPDRLVGTTPHLYIYTISNVGEAMIAKRRSYAGIQSYLTPPFMESELRGTYKELKDAISAYYTALETGGEAAAESRKVKDIVLEMGIHRDLRLDSLSISGYTEEEISRIDNFAEELTNEKITGELYTMGEAYEPGRIRSSVFAMASDPIAYAMLALDRQRGRAEAGLEENSRVFNRDYLEPAKDIVRRVLDNPSIADDAFICRLAEVSADELSEARKTVERLDRPRSMMEMMTGSAGARSEPQITDEYEAFARTLNQLATAVENINNYSEALRESPEEEFRSLLNAMDGGYTAPSPGGDPIVNPNTLPTGRNLYAVNAEATPSEKAWEEGKKLAEKTIEMYRRNHNDSIPRKVSYTLWSGEFIETEGATIAQVLYMLGVEPVRDAFGRVTDLRLIPSEELGRPRIDVVVQTSGQLRDIAASRLFLISRAVEMAAAARDDVYENRVASGVVESEKMLTDRGVSPREARELSRYRVFGGLNGGYGTGITGMIQNGDSWEDSGEIADRYMQNMGAYYGSEDEWEKYGEFAFEAALGGTDVVVQPRQSNTWGALSLDHVYEFMGGMNLAVQKVTGKDPDAYLSDYRNHHNMRMQELKEAIGVEGRTTIFNPAYIREKMKGGASAAAGFAEVVQNTYGWNVTKPSVVDDEMWDEIYNVYVKDELNLGIEDWFGDKNPAALEEMTAVMMETARKGMWDASEQQLCDIASLHTRLVDEYLPSCSETVCDNVPLRNFIASNVDASVAGRYNANIENIREARVSGQDGVVMKREVMDDGAAERKAVLSNTVVVAFAAAAIVVIVLLVRRRRKNSVQ